MWNQNFLDNLSVVSFYLGLMNLQQNLSQSDKDELIRSMSTTNQELLQKLEIDIDEQNDMLKDIIRRLDKIESDIQKK